MKSDYPTWPQVPEHRDGGDDGEIPATWTPGHESESAAAGGTDSAAVAIVIMWPQTPGKTARAADPTARAALMRLMAAY